MAQATPLATVLATSDALVDQFVASLDVANASQALSPLESTSHPSPLHLLAAAATSLKAAVTKISLLTITAPFTPSALVSTIQPLHTSVLPSLVTAALLTSSTFYPESFSKECNALSRNSLRDFKLLVSFVKTRLEDGQPRRDITDSDKKNVTEATGRIWEDCDLLLKFSKEDVGGFICRKAGQWLDLMKDAVKEFEEWDPEEDIGDDPFGLDDAQSDDDDEDLATNEPEKDANRATMAAGVKEQALRVLSRIPQSIHVVVRQRLAKLPSSTTTDSRMPMVPMPTTRRKILDNIIKRTRKISDCIDESAEAMYMGDPEKCLKKAGEARALTIDVVTAVIEPWEESEQETKEDQYIKRALTWIQQVETNGQQPKANTTDKGKTKA